jgi:hypothetical protein
MKNFILLAVVAILSACSSAPKETYERRAYDERQERTVAAQKAVDEMPSWFKEPPTSKDAVFAVGEGSGTTINWAITKAKQAAYGEICMASGGKVDQQTKLFRSEVGTQYAENSNSATRSFCPGVDITGVETVNKFNSEPGTKVIANGTGFRAYVLVALPTGTANQLQQRKDKLEAGRQASRQSEAAFREMDKAEFKTTQ